MCCGNWGTGRDERDGEDHYQPGAGGPGAGGAAGAGGFLLEPDGLYPDGDTEPDLHARRGRPSDGRPQDAGTRARALHPTGFGGRQGGWGDPGDQGLRAREHRRRRQPRARPGDHRLDRRAGRPAGEPGSKVGAGRQDKVLITRSERQMINENMQARMAEATRLTQEGRLNEATAILQSALGNNVPPAGPNPGADGFNAPIDVTSRLVGGGQQGPAAPWRGAGMGPDMFQAGPTLLSRRGPAPPG